MISNRKKHLGGGITLDVGVYTIQFCLLVFKQEPISVKASGIVNNDGVDVEVNAELLFPGNKTANIRISALHTFENAAKIHGTKGTLTVIIELSEVHFQNILTFVSFCVCVCYFSDALFCCSEFNY